MSHDGSEEALQVSEGLLPSSPVMPSVPRTDIYRGRPNLLLEDGLRHSLGWQDHRKKGLSIVVVRLGWLDRVKVKERFPLTEQGWAAAWQALSGLDAAAAAAIARKLEELESGRRAVAALAALDAETLRCLPRMTYNGGAGGAPLAKGRGYDVRFLGDRIMICSPGLTVAVVEVPYGDVETVEVSDSSSESSSGQLVVLIMVLGLVGALLGLVLFGIVGLLMGGVLFGLVGALAGAASTKVGTVIRLLGRDTDFYFVQAGSATDALRIELAEPLRVIDNARAARAGTADAPQDRAAESIPDQLSKLASLLQQDLITRDEFERLKARLIATS